MIGVLALQGAFIEHMDMLRRLGVASVALRQKSDLDRAFDGIILPGGESTAIAKLLHDLGMFLPLQERFRQGLPVFGTCAGMILLARQIENEPAAHLGTMDICVTRNAYGRQLGSFASYGDFADKKNIQMPFIRAPFIKQADENVEILAVVEGNRVAARQGNKLVTAFHPELTEDTSIHEYFLNIIASQTN